ncbi:MAG: hypothetical protein AB7N90_09400 [Vicinamibacterales bacterium]
MKNRWLRLLLVVLALGGTVGLGYRAWQDEQARDAEAASARNQATRADRALIKIGDLRASLHAYVAAGQGQAFWTARTTVLLDELRTAMLSMDAAAAAADRSFTASLGAIDQLAAAERRARDYVRGGQALMAGDVIFTEARDLLDGVQAEVIDVSGAVQAAATNRQAALAAEQATLAGAAAGLWLLVALLLVPTPRVSSMTASGELLGLHDLPAPAGGTAVADEPAPAAPPVDPRPEVDLPAAAALCGDLARLSDSAALGGLLERAAGVLGASGMIVWTTGPGQAALFPVATFGYDARLLDRIGSIPRDADNMTADAFRAVATCTVGPHAGAPAAIAAPLVGPDGAIGVLSAEVPGVEAVGRHRAALAGIFAAQLATLVGAMPPAAGDDEPEAPAEPADEPVAAGEAADDPDPQAQNG